VCGGDGRLARTSLPSGSPKSLTKPTTKRYSQERGTTIAQTLSASEWIAKFEARREAQLGSIEKLTVAAPTDVEYPAAKLNCAHCGKESRQRVALNGLNYYCKNPACRAAEARWVRARAS